MALNVHTTLEIRGDRDMLERVATRLRSRTRFHEQIGLLGMSQAMSRLSDKMAASEGGIRRGFLQNSFNVARAGGGGGQDGATFSRSGGDEHTILEADEQGGAYGSNLPYAAQRNFGGRITPTGGKKALAIPLDDRLRRHGISPSKLDPARKLLDFVRISGGASGNVFGLLVDNEGIVGQLAGGKKGEGEAVYALARYVDQEGWFFAGWTPEDVRILEEDLFPGWLGVKG